MRIDVLASGSGGNCYALHCSDGNVLLLDAGIRYQEVIGVLDGLQGLSGALITHEHMDHAKCAAQLMRLGVDVYMSQGTARALDIAPFERVRYVSDRERVRIGCMDVLPFKTEHDAAEPLGFLIRDGGTGETLLYATDTYYVRYKFAGVTHWLIECNYIDGLVACMENKKLRERLLKSHMSLNRLKELFVANDMGKTKQIILCHLSNERSDESRMEREIEELTGVKTIAADVGMIIDTGGEGA